MIRASDPPMKSRRSGFIECGAVVRSLSLILIGVLRCLPISKRVTDTFTAAKLSSISAIE